jgi:hypothetical protein
MECLKQNAAATFLVGPVLDSAGAAVTTAVIADFNITKNGTTAALGSPASVSHSHNGYYLLSLATGNTNTIGMLEVSVNNSAMSMGSHGYMVLEPTVYDALFSKTFDTSGGLGDVTRFAGQAITAAAPVTLPASVANDATVAKDSTVAKDATVAKEATVNSVLTAIQNLNNLSAKMNIYGAPLLEIPDSGSTVYAFTVVVRDDEDKLVNLDASPTLTAANAAGTSRSGNLSAVSNPSTGRYTFSYTVANTHPAESLRITVSGTVSGEARYIEWIGAVVDYATLTLLQQISTDLSGKPTLAQIEASTTLAMKADIPTANQNKDAIYSAMPNAGYPNGSFGDRFLISDSDQREVKVTGAAHVAADIHELQPGVIESTHFATGAIDSNALAASAATEVANAVGALQVLIDLVAMITGSGTALVKWSANALSLAPTGGGGGGTGTGARTVTITVNLAGSPVEGAKVRLTKAAESYLGTTNVSGQVTFNVDDGSWIVGITSPNTTFAGAVLAVSGNVSQSYNVTAISITPSSPGNVTGYWLCLGANGLPESGVTMSMQAVSIDCDISGLALDTTVRTTTSNGSGVAQFPDLTPGVRYQAWRGTGAKVYVTIPTDASGTLELNSLLGSP